MNTLQTKNLILRPFRKNDEDAMYKNWTYDERVSRHCRWFPHTNVNETKEYLNMCLESKYCWAITLKEQDEPIGCIELVGKNHFGVDEIGYVLMHDAWGRGYMTEALSAVIDELFSEGYEKLGACHNTDNPASGKVMEKCGMTYVTIYEGLKKFGSDETCEVRYYEINN